MRFYLSPVTSTGAVVVRAVMEGDGMIGDFVQPIGPGEDFYGTPFDELVKLGPGEHDLPFDDDEPEDD